MKYKVIVPFLVRHEIEEAVDYYNHKQPGLGDELYFDVEELLEFIEKAPSSFQRYHQKYRQASLKKFPYLLVFREYDLTVLINKFIHAKRHPAKRYRQK